MNVMPITALLCTALLMTGCVSNPPVPLVDTADTVLAALFRPSQNGARVQSCRQTVIRFEMVPMMIESS